MPLQMARLSETIREKVELVNASYFFLFQQYVMLLATNSYYPCMLYCFSEYVLKVTFFTADHFAKRIYGFDAKIITRL